MSDEIVKQLFQHDLYLIITCNFAVVATATLQLVLSTTSISVIVSLSTLVLNSWDQQGNLWLPQKCIFKTTLQQSFPLQCYHKIY